MKLCKDCGIQPCKVIVPSASKPRITTEARCDACQRKFKKNKARITRLRKTEKLLLRNDRLIKTGWKICKYCKRKKRLSEYQTSMPHRNGIINDMCDRCLTRIYNNRKSVGFDYTYWRRKAYSCNSTARSRLSRIQRKSRYASLNYASLLDLSFECKPQHLSELYSKQNGKCGYCDIVLDSKKVATDHKIPLSRDGKHELSNLALACHDCNNLKHRKTAEEFHAFLHEYAHRILALESKDKEPSR